MEKIFGRIVVLILVMITVFSGCKGVTAPGENIKVAVVDEKSPEELYEAALEEDTLVVYTVTTRVVDTKEAFEKAYPGLLVEVRDLRSPNLIEEVEKGSLNTTPVCDVVLCNDNSGEFKSRLVDTGIVVPYLPKDIRTHMKEDNADGMVSFLNEAEILFYSTKEFKECPIKNIWELTDEKYKERIYMPNPLRSFSTYAFCASSMDKGDELSDAYAECFGEMIPLTGSETAAEFFWKKVSENIIFTNSSDEVTEALNDGKADFGWCVSSKLRLAEVGYCLAPVYKLSPFSGCRTSYSVMMTAGCEHENAAKLFIRFLLGESDGRGEGYKPFCTAGTWSARSDVPDGNEIPFDEIDLLVPDQRKLIDEKEKDVLFWTEILKGDQ